jgi:molybdenum cofactor biosynthesis protein B
MGHIDHKHKASNISVNVGILTVSDTRTESDDTSGSFIRQALVEAGHSVTGYSIVKDEPALIVQTVGDIAEAGMADAVIINGGTGISKRDSTFDAVERLLEKRLPGFGEIFRMLSYGEIGSAAMMSRAVAGTYRDMVIFSIPGSEPAVRLAMGKLILPELGHAVWELRR